MLIGIETASPPYKVSQQKAAEELKLRMANRPAAARLIDSAAAHSGIDNRCIVIPDAEENAEKKFFSQNGSYINPDTKIRMEHYEHWAKTLTGEAVEKVLNRHNIKPEEIDRLITISCTGFFAPGIDYYLMNKFNLPLSVKRTNIGFMGCAAAVIGINSALEVLNSAFEEEKNILLVAVEICSIHLQTEATRDNILANIIFADGAAAAFFSNSKKYRGRLKILHTASVLFNNSAEFMGWKIGNSGFEMILSSELPKIILNEAAPKLKEILSGFNLRTEDIKHWALHPGGRAILDSLQQGLNLTDEQTSASRSVLQNYGNMSSASIMFVIKQLLDDEKIKKDEYCCAAAFGPGLTMEVAVFKGL